jgi:prolyl 4-hydroxylase
VILENGTRMLDEQRTSSTAFLGKSDPVVECILHRAAEIQGLHDINEMEDLQITAYAESQQYRPHYDWFAENLIPSMEYKNRISTFFVTIDADCENCGTQFPRLSVDWSTKDQRWCQFVECEDREKLTVKAIPGSAVFWRNLHEDGWGNPKTLHAGLPVPNGRKVGVNIWSRGPVPGPVNQ